MKVVKIWLDDIRDKPEEFDVSVGSEIETIILLRNLKNIDVFISFDHDLGLENGSGYGVACFIEANPDLVRLVGFDVHSANPVGRRNIEQALRKYKKIKINEL